ncbi:MAG: HD domain-containing protein [Rhodospirillales bacterium]|nr:HD domain-containing protein [Rhodospirillales bacterium]MBT4039603.1 HD domain-containing protein [Rhodospirillales bacterium]MBT4627729.1 HD domain-containing protein [Rhodospirillales bacterium]MBT5351303.1 HD domain-containing protein [Rhodospirillales bacterium]MBT5521458.1 HD domain-containing protein [Rhodospirillales bacterium]
MAESSIKVPLIYLIAADKEREGEMLRALGRRYEFLTFVDTGALLHQVMIKRPAVIICEDTAPPNGGNKFRERIRVDPDTHTVPIILTGNGSNVPKMNNVIDRYLLWPFKKSQIIDCISDLINVAAEQQWEALPTLQKETLKLTVEEYQDVATAIENGDPIDYHKASDSCTPLVKAIQDNGHHELLKSVQNHHNYTYVHSLRVATLLTMFGHGIGMDEDNMNILATGGLLHDVGKLVTPDNILNKPGKLDDEEWPIMQDHVVQSRDLLQAGDDVSKGAHIIAAQHHEKLDGSGYPLGLKGAEMNELARMSCICDIFGALTDARSYKPAFPTEKAFGILESMDKGLDMGLLKVFKEIFSDTQPAE